MYEKLRKTIASFDQIEISQKRKEVLQQLIDYLNDKRAQHKEIALNFVCTHNSRRSQMSQLWAQTASDFYGIETICYSGGTEVTAFHENAIQTLASNGFKMDVGEGDNPKVLASWSSESRLAMWSKTAEDESSNLPFAAIMTCAHADENCPVIIGAESRISIQYEDPKAFDNTALMAEKYTERSLQIGREMFYVFKQVK